MQPFDELKDLTFDELCERLKAAYEAKEIEMDILVSIAGQYAVYHYQKQLKQ